MLYFVLGAQAHIGQTTFIFLFYYLDYTCSHAHTYTHKCLYTPQRSQKVQQAVCPICVSPTNLHAYGRANKCAPSLWFLELIMAHLFLSTHSLWLSNFLYFLIIYEIRAFSRATKSWVFRAFIFKGWTCFLRNTKPNWTLMQILFN